MRARIVLVCILAVLVGGVSGCKFGQTVKDNMGIVKGLVQAGASNAIYFALKDKDDKADLACQVRDIAASLVTDIEVNGVSAETVEQIVGAFDLDDSVKEQIGLAVLNLTPYLNFDAATAKIGEDNLDLVQCFLKGVRDGCGLICKE